MHRYLHQNIILQTQVSSPKHHPTDKGIFNKTSSYRQVSSPKHHPTDTGIFTKTSSYIQKYLHQIILQTQVSSTKHHATDKDIQELIYCAVCGHFPHSLVFFSSRNGGILFVIEEVKVLLEKATF